MRIHIKTLILLFFILFVSNSAGVSGFVFETETLRYVIGADGINNSLVEKKSNREWLKSGNTSFTSIKKGGKLFAVTSLASVNGNLKAVFGQSGVEAEFKVESREDVIVVELIALSGEGVEEVRLAQLYPSSMKNAGAMLAVRWDNDFAVCLMGLSDRVHSRLDTDGSILASVYPEFGMIGERVAIVAAPTKEFLTEVQKAERVFALPSPKLSNKWAKASTDIRESYLFTDLTEANADEMIRYAKLSGFTYILIYSDTWSSSIGSYLINTRNFPRGEISLKAVIDKCHTAGIKVGMHMLTSFVAKKDPLVRPKPDTRLLKDAEAILASDIDEKTIEIVSVKSLSDFPTQQAFYWSGNAGLDIQIDNEIIHYDTIGGINSTMFLQCIRGYAGTVAAPHKRGTKIYHLAERYGWYLVDLKTSLKDELSERIAGLINRLGFDMIYFDGGDGNRANGPFWYWGSQQQMDIWKRLKRDILAQGAVMTNWSWHIYGRGACDDFAAIAPKQYLDYHKIADAWQAYKGSFFPAELGWWGFFSDAPHHPATTPDEVEYYAIRMLSLDAPVSLETNLNALKANGRTEEMLKLLGKYEKLRLQKALPESVLTTLRSGEWHALWRSENPDFHPVRYDTQRVRIPGEILVQNEFGPQPLKFRLQAVSQLAKVGDNSNIVIFHSERPMIMKPIDAKAVMPGALSGRVEFGKSDGELSSAFMVIPGIDHIKGQKGKSLDLANHRALAVRLKVDGSMLKPGEPPAVLNVQLESNNKTYRDHYIDLDFIGERTIIIPEPTTERMLPEFRPAHENYAFKAAMYDNFNHKDIAAVNFRWMRQIVTRPMQCSVSLVEALKETDSVITNPTITIGTQQIDIPITLRSGDYAEYWGDGPLRVFDRNGVQLSTAEIPSVSSLLSGFNRISIEGKKTGLAKLTTILLGEALKY